MRRVGTFLLALSAFVLFTIPAMAAERDYYKVGVVTSLSGDLATGGNVTKRGYDLWAKTVNEQGGIEVNGKKYKVKLYYGDDGSQPAQGAMAAERLATQEGVDFVLGPYASGVTLAAAPVLEKYSVPMITGSAESPMIWLQKFKYTFGTVPAVTFTAAAAIKSIAALKPQPKTAIIIGSNDAFSKATAEAFQTAAKSAGIKVLKFNIVPSGQDLTPFLSAAKNLQPDLIAFGGHDEELINLVKALVQIDYTPKALLMHYGVTEPAFIEGLGKNANDVFGASVWTGDLPIKGAYLWPTAKAYADAAQKEFKTPADYTQAGCSAAGIAFQVALQKAALAPPLDQAKRQKLVNALENLDISTFYGTIRFAKSGEFYHSNVGVKPITVQIQKGQVVVVGPANLAKAPAVYPMTPWNKR